MEDQKWNWVSSSHPISDVRDWHLVNRLNLKPDYQRTEVWSEAAQIMLIDTILQNIPMPKVFLTARIVDRRTYRTVIDGQQRLRAILRFINDDLALNPPFKGEYPGCKFSELPDSVQN